MKLLVLGVALVTCFQLIFTDAAASPRWLCGLDYPYAECATKDYCGTTPEFPMVCVNADHVVDPTEAACSDIPKPDVTDSSGCGTWMCRAPSGKFVPCDHPSVCMEGCSKEEVEMTEDAKKRIPLKCVRNGIFQEHLCPDGLVPPPTFQSKCIPRSGCKLLCTKPGTNTAVSCTSADAYESCPKDKCGTFNHFPNTVCTTGSVFPGSEVNDAIIIDHDMCKYHDQRPQKCLGSACDDAEYRYACRSTYSDDPASYAPCPADDEADGFSTFTPCSERCNSGRRDRVVKCAVFKAGSDVASAFDEDNVKCSGEAPRRRVSCEGPPCKPVWHCVAPDQLMMHSTPCHMQEKTAYQCDASSCGIITAKRAVTCKSGSTVVDASLCSDLPVPSIVMECPPEGSECSTSARSAPCDLAADGSIDPDFSESGGPSCIMPGQPQPFRKNRCFDGDVFVDDVNCAAGNISLIEECSLPDCTDFTPQYGWQTVMGPCQFRETHCMSYRVDTVYCAVEGFPDAAVDDSHCDVLEKPQAVQPCNATDNTVSNSPFEMTSCNVYNDATGTCVAKGFAIVDGIEYPEIELGRCECNAFTAPPFCRRPASINVVSARFDEETEDILISTTSDTPMFNEATIFAMLRIVGTIPTLALPQHRFPATKLVGSSPGEVRINVNATAYVSLTSDATVVLPPICSLRDAQCKVGECISSSGKCMCPRGYSGTRCEMSICDNYCSEFGAESCTVNDVGQPVCACKEESGTPLFSGEKCEVPQQCVNTSCSNGGKPVGEVLNDGSVICSCNCTGAFGGDRCDTCKINNFSCKHNGTVGEDCSGCSCSEGRDGRFCSCRSLRIRYVVGGDAVPWYGTSSEFFILPSWLERQADAARLIWFDIYYSGSWAKILTHELFMHEKSSKKYLLITADVGLPCAVDDDDFAALDFPFASSSDDDSSTSPYVYRLISPLKSAATHVGPTGFLRELGVGISDLNCEGSECPSDLGEGGALPSGSVPVPRGGGDGGGDGGSPSSGGGLSTSEKIVIGICVGVGVPLLALFVYLMYRFLSHPPASRPATSTDVELAETNVV